MQKILVNELNEYNLESFVDFYKSQKQQFMIFYNTVFYRSSNMYTLDTSVLVQFISIKSTDIYNYIVNNNIDILLTNNLLNSKIDYLKIETETKCKIMLALENNTYYNVQNIISNFNNNILIKQDNIVNNTLYNNNTPFPSPKPIKIQQNNTQLVKKKESIYKQNNKIETRLNILEKLPIFCINLKKNPERREFIKLQSKNKNVTFVDAVYGKDLEPNILEKYTKKSAKSIQIKEPLSPNEIGCLLSHIKAYKESLEKSDSEYVIIIEDDANLISYINNEQSKFVLNNITKYECLQLCLILSNSYNLLNKETNIILNWKEENNKYNGLAGLWSSAAYIISKKARQKMLDEFENQIYTVADLYIYKNLNTGVLFPPIVLPNDYLESEINNNIPLHIASKRRILNYYYNKTLILVTTWFGKLPTYFDLYLYTLQNQNYDILLITDQIIKKHPNNLKVLYMSFEDFNNYLNTKLNYDVKIKNHYKLVDTKPLLGHLFFDYINDYIYWGWTDIDMIMGDVTSFIPQSYDYDVISYGYSTFGPLTIFKTNITDLYKYIEHYEEILNDEYICKVDELFWFVNNKNTEHLKVYTDELVDVKYYDGNNITKYLNSKKVHINPWTNICTGINWSIKNSNVETYNQTVSYKFTNGKLYKNNSEIHFGHLTLLKLQPEFIKFINNKLNNDNLFFEFNVCYKYNNNKIPETLNNYNTYDMYKNFITIEYV